MIERNRPQPPSNRRPVSILVGLTGILAAAFCTTDWLSNPSLSQQLWPSDIQSSVVGILGGKTATGVTGLPEYDISLTAILLRTFAAIIVFLALSRVFNPRATLSELSESLLLRLGILGYLAAFVWGVQLIAYEAFLQGLLPPLLMMLAGGVAFSCLSIWLPSSSFGGKSRSAIWFLVLVTIGWIAVSFQLNERLYTNLLIPHGDSAMYEEHLWNVWHGKGFRSYLDQGLFLGEHIQVIHLLLLPVHMIWPSHMMLELAESIALGSCTIPLFLMVRRRTNNEAAASLLAVSWLFFFPMHFLDIAIDQKTFRPVCLGLPFLLWMIHSAEIGRYKSAWLFLLIALSAKEDMALITAPLTAVLALLAHRNGESELRLRNWSLMACGVSAVWLISAVVVVIPAFRSGEVVHYSRYFGDLGNSPGELIRTAFTKPGLVFTQLLSIRTGLYALVFLTPVAFVGARCPLHLLAGLPTFIMLSLIQLGNGPQEGGLPPIPYHHFHAPLLPVIFWATACAVAGFTRQTNSKWQIAPQSPTAAALLVLCCCVATGVTGSILPYGAGFWADQSSFGRHAIYYPRLSEASERQLIERSAMAKIAVNQIPMQARVASTDFIHTRLTHRERSYDYSGYHRVVNEQGKRVPKDCDYIVIDTGHRYSEFRNADDIPELTESSNWRLLPDRTGGQFLILHRTQ
jgi:uncharacterized membrane protein